MAISSAFRLNALKHAVTATVFAGAVAFSAPASAFGDNTGPGNWAGFYLGGHLGVGGQDYSGRIDTSSTTNPIEDPSDLDMSGILGGFQIGYNYQSGYWVFGVEGDVSFVDWSDRERAARTDLSALAGSTPDTQFGDTDVIASLRGRAGVIYESFLIFGTAGIAVTDADFAYSDDESGAKGGLDFNDVGFVIGAGVEKALDGTPWRVRGEGLYYIFNDRRSASTLTPDNDPADSVKFEDAWAVRLVVNYALGDLFR